MLTIKERKRNNVMLQLQKGAAFFWCFLFGYCVRKKLIFVTSSFVKAFKIRRINFLLPYK
jgi:hypothetical protein